MQTAQLVPVSEWVYDLYLVKYWKGDPDNGGRVVKTTHMASSSGNHLATDANESCPFDADYISWDVVKENVGSPHVVGNMHGLPVYESGQVFGQRLAQQM